MELSYSSHFAALQIYSVTTSCGLTPLSISLLCFSMSFPFHLPRKGLCYFPLDKINITTEICTLLWKGWVEWWPQNKFCISYFSHISPRQKGSQGGRNLRVASLFQSIWFQSFDPRFGDLTPPSQHLFLLLYLHDLQVLQKHLYWCIIDIKNCTFEWIQVDKFYICIHWWNHHNQANKNIHHLLRFLCVLLSFGVRTLNMRYTLLKKF